MSQRYEGAEATVNLELVSPGTRVGEVILDESSYALVMGNPEELAYVLEGTPAELLAFAGRMSEMLARELLTPTGPWTGPR